MSLFLRRPGTFLKIHDLRVLIRNQSNPGFHIKNKKLYEKKHYTRYRSCCMQRDHDFTINVSECSGKFVIQSII